MCDQIIAKLVKEALEQKRAIIFDRDFRDGGRAYVADMDFHRNESDKKFLSSLGCNCKFIPAEPCPFCNGTGKDKGDPCPECNGTGKES